MKGFIFGVIITLLVLAAGAYIYFAGGYAPVATSAQAMPFETTMANKALNARVDKEAPKNAPFQPDDATYLAGAAIYKMNCAVCHGLPGGEQTPVAKGEYPKPPQLFKGHGVTDDPPGETYWKVANGIRLTGMPAFKPSLSETQLWQVSWLLKNADKLPAAAQQELGGAIQMSAPSGRAGGEHQHNHE
ncbi:MAG: c-type cytochrome [Terriglobales bacterium]|jgi:thiosulfate dehydrogenase